MTRLRPALFILFAMSAMLVGGCSLQPSGTSAPPTVRDKSVPSNGSGPSESTGYHQSPYLDGKSLPPVAQRLPDDPKITNEMPSELVNYQIGRYGGTLRTVTAVANWDADVFVMNNEPLLNTPGILGKEITGNVLKSYDVSADQKTFTFHMRKGLKWSDGQPVTVEDVRFAVEDVLFNKDLTPAIPVWLRTDGMATGDPMKFRVIDDSTFTISFSQPYGGFPMRIAVEGWRGYTDLLKPAHFLKQFHNKYAESQALAEKVKEAGFKPGEWVKLFTSKDVANTDLCNSKAIGFPVLYPWVLVRKTQTTEYFERNPYYFKVDTAGNQLPYIDQMQSTLVQDMNTVVMKALAGEVDFQRESAALINMPLYKQNEKNGYKVLLASMHNTPTDIFLNLTYNDPEWRKVVQDLRFRQALNKALNRKEIINSIYYGFAEPGKMEDSTFDLAGANKLLDEMGMKKGPDGFRDSPDGKTFIIPFEVSSMAPDIVPLTELVMEQWKALGLNVTMKVIDQSLWGQRSAANELLATVMWSPTPQWWRGDAYTSMWAPLWDSWRRTGKGEEPPAVVRDFYNTVNQMGIAPPNEAKTAFAQTQADMGKNLWFFVPIENVKQPLIVNAKLGNVTDKGFAIATNFEGEQLFFKQ